MNIYKHPNFDLPHVRLAKIRDEYLAHIPGDLLPQLTRKDEGAFEGLGPHKISFSRIDVCIIGEVLGREGREVMYDGLMFQPFRWDICIKYAARIEATPEGALSFGQRMISVAQFADQLRKLYGGVVYEYMSTEISFNLDVVREQTLKLYLAMKDEGLLDGMDIGSVRKSDKASVLARELLVTRGVYNVFGDPEHQILVSESDFSAYVRKIRA